MDESITQFESQFRHAGYLMVKVTRNYLEQHGLSMSRFWVLAYVNKRTGLTMGDLKQSMMLSGSSVSGLADQLIMDGFLRRERDSDDRRIVRLSLTSKGANLVKDTMEFRRKQIESALQYTDQEHLQTATNLLRQINKTLRSQLDVDSASPNDTEENT